MSAWTRVIHIQATDADTDADAFIIGSAIVHARGGAEWVAAAYIALLALTTLVNPGGIRVSGGVQDAATY